MFGFWRGGGGKKPSRDEANFFYFAYSRKYIFAILKRRTLPPIGKDVIPLNLWNIVLLLFGLRRKFNILYCSICSVLSRQNWPMAMQEFAPRFKNFLQVCILKGFTESFHDYEILESSAKLWLFSRRCKTPSSFSNPMIMEIFDALEYLYNLMWLQFIFIK
jgi:hypothetical protein